MANHLAMAAILKSGDKVLIERPGYPLLRETAEYLGARVKSFERPESRDFAIDLSILKRSITPNTRLIVLTNLHNPSGALTPDSVLRQIGELAASAGARVLVDEAYLDVLFEDAPETSFKLGPHFVVTNSLSKVYGLNGLRCGWILADPELIRKIYRLNDLFGVNNPYVTDQISCLALAHLKHIAQWSRDLLDRNRALAHEFLAATPQLDGQPLTAGTVLFPRVKLPVAEFCRFLRERYDTVVTPGQFFDAPERIRIGLGGETGILSEALSRIHQALSEMSAAGR